MLMNVLNTESLELLSTSSKYQSQKVHEDYEDLMKPSCNKRSLDNTITNNESITKQVSI